MSYIEGYFKNPKYTQFMQIVVAFVAGIVFAPYSYGFIFLLIYLIAYEIVYLFFTRGCYPYWDSLFRVAVIAASIYGWIIGRTIVGWRNPFNRDPNAP